MEPTYIDIPYTPRHWADRFHESFLRWSVLVMHRRAGKTTAAVNHVIRAALDNEWEARRLKYLAPDLTDKDIQTLMRDRFYMHILPTYTQAKLSVWPILKFHVDPIPGVKTNETELSVKFPNGSVYQLFGADNKNSLRGPPPSGAVFDEYSQHPPGIFDEVISKALADHLGFGVFSGTIIGKNQLWKLHEMVKADPTWLSLWQPVDVSLATESGAAIKAIRQSLQDDADLVRKGIMTQESFDQEWYLSPTAAIKGAYYAKHVGEAMRDERFTWVPYDPELPVFIVSDLGVGPAFATGFYQKLSGQVRMIDYLEGSEGDGIPQIVKKIREKPYIYRQWTLPHDAAARSTDTGQTRVQTIQKLWPGIEIKVLKRTKVDDRIDRGRAVFVRLLVDEKRCAKWIESISQYRQEWDAKRGMFNENPLHDWTSHGADVHGYMADDEKSWNNDLPRIQLPTLPEADSEYGG